jgi:hypothetical protein
MGIGLRELLVVVIVAVAVGGAIALFLPRKRVPLKAKRIIACVWIVLGIVQIVRGASYPTAAGTAMAITGLAEVSVFGGALLMFTDKRWMRVLGGCVVFAGLLLLMAAGALRNSTPHH